MNSEYVQNLRYKLQKRVRRLNSSGYPVHQYTLRQFLLFIERSPVLVSIIPPLLRRVPKAEEMAKGVVEKNETWLLDDELEHVAVAYYVLKLVSASSSMKQAGVIGMGYKKGGDLNQGLAFFNDYFVEPLYDYLDEQLDDRGAVLALLRRYKHRAEWFNREALYSLATDDSGKGERKLAAHLYEYLHDQGIDFFIEPSSASGEADLIAMQKGNEPLIADAKVFAPAKGKGTPYICKGFNQVYIYTLDFNEPFGFLVIYNISGEDLRFALADKSQSIPFLTHSNKTVFFVVIDIFPHETSASKRGTLKTHEITEAALVSVLPAPDNNTLSPAAPHNE